MSSFIEQQGILAYALTEILREKKRGGEVMRRDAEKHGPSLGIVGDVTHRDEYSELPIRCV